MASQASIASDSLGGNDTPDDISFTSDRQAPADGSQQLTQRRRRWTFQLKRKNDDPDTRSEAFKGLSVSCRCKSAINGTCLLTVGALLELIGNLIFLVYGITFIMDAVNFYNLENNPENITQNYEERLDDVVYLSQNKVGIVGLLAVSVAGLAVSFILPVGTSLRNYKILYAAMSLLFAMCVFHVILLFSHIHRTNLLATVAVIPFRIIEIFIIYAFIRYNKKKRREEAKPCQEGAEQPCDPTFPEGQILLDGGVVATGNGVDQGLGQLPDSQVVDLNAVQVTFDMSQSQLAGQDPTKQMITDLSPTNGGDDSRTQRKRLKLFRMFQGERKPRISFPSYISRPERDRYVETNFEMK